MTKNYTGTEVAVLVKHVGPRINNYTIITATADLGQYWLEGRNLEIRPDDLLLLREYLYADSVLRLWEVVESD